MGLSVLVFLMLRLVPGTVVEQMIGADAIASPAMVAELKRFFGLDQPWWQQYGRWVAGLAHGDLGTSWRTGKPVVALILERLPVTIELTSLAVGFAMLLGIPAGILSARRRDQTIDNVTRVGTLLGLSIPVFWQGTMLILFFSIYLRWMPPVVWVDFFADPGRNLTIMFTRDGPLKGAEAMRPLFQALIEEFGKPGGWFSLKRQSIEGDYAYILWTAETADNVYEVATDTFVVRDGKITAQSFTGKIVPKGSPPAR